VVRILADHGGLCRGSHDFHHGVPHGFYEPGYARLGQEAMGAFSLLGATGETSKAERG
jgi:hypothetical protein